MGKVQTSSRPENQAVSGQADEAIALTAIKHLLGVDLHRVTCQEREAAEAALRAHPSNSELILAMKRWAAALATVCRSHARECARVHANCTEKDPATSAMGTILVTLSDHLGLPTDKILLLEIWPVENAVREFVLEVSGAPVELIDGDIVRTPTVPRWEPKSIFARRIAGLEPRPPQGKNAAFLSIDETQKVLRGLEESFRNSLWEGLGSSFSEAVLETNLVVGDSQTSGLATNTSAAQLEKRVTKLERRKETRKRYFSKYKRAIFATLRDYPNATTQEVCASVDERCGHTRTDKAWALQHYKKTRQHKSHLSMICQVKRDMGLITDRKTTQQT